MRSKRFFALLSLAAFLLFAAASFAQQAGDRIGIEENFDTMDGWKKIVFPGEDAPLKEMKSEAGVGVFVTHPAPLRSQKGNPKWHDGMTPYDPLSNIAKTWPELDLDKYRYLVMKIDEKVCPCSVIINHVDLPIAYTTGVRAVDLSLYSYGDTELKGKQAIEFRMQFGNTGGHVRIDWFRFVSELTPEEKKGLIPEGIVVRPEGLTHHPTQGLDAVMKRADRPRRDTIPTEKLCFRDKATGAVIWRMTGLQSGASIVSDSARGIFNASGSVMLFPSRTGGPQLYDFQKDEFMLSPHAGTSRFSPKDPDILWCVEKTRRPAGIRFHKINIRTGMDEIAGEISFEGKQFRTSIADLGFAANTDQIAVGFRESKHVYILDPDEREPSKRLRHIELPMRLKGMELSPDGKRISWSRCYWYEGWEMDVESAKIRRALRIGGSHAGGGGGLRLGHYQGLILAYPQGLNDWQAGEKVKILLNYRKGWHTDYGHLSRDRLWYIANGTAGDMANKLIMASTRDPGAVLQIAFQNTSRNDWGNNTVIKSSPDYTKLTWVSNIWGYDAVCVAFTRRPEPPQNLTAKREGDAVLLKWSRPAMMGDWRPPQETQGYNVYRSVGNGALLPMNRDPIRGETWRDENVASDNLYKYVVCAQEHSGLEGVPSNEAIIGPLENAKIPPLVHQFHLEAEHAMLTPPARTVFSGWTSGWRCVRIGKQVETESTGRLEWRFTPQFGGKHVLWLRVRTAGKPGTWQVALDGSALGAAAVTARDWEWVKLDGPAQLEPAKQNRLILTSADDGLSLDKIILTQNPNYVPQTLDDRFRTPPVKLQHLVTKEVTESSAHLAWWNPKAEKDLDYYNVYVGETADSATDQAHLVASTRRTELLDWGLTPGKTYTYKVTAVNRRGLESEPSALTAQTKRVAQPVLLALTIDQAALDPRLKKETRAGVRCAYLPGKESDSGEGPLADITWEFSLPVAGEYTIWCQYAPADYSRGSMRIPVLLDDFLGGKATWQMRTPYRAMSGPNYRLWKEDLWFTDKLSMYVWPKPRDLFRLSAGKHKLTLRMSPKMREFHHKIGTVWITNDPPFRPPGWDPQADFKKAKLKRR